MTVDFNNLRKQTAYSLDRVIKTLNKGILPKTEHVAVDQSDGSYEWKEGDVLVSTEDLQKDLDELRQNVWLLLCCYEEGNPEYAMVYEEVEKRGGLASFNDPDDQS